MADACEQPLPEHDVVCKPPQLPGVRSNPVLPETSVRWARSLHVLVGPPTERFIRTDHHARRGLDVHDRCRSPDVGHGLVPGITAGGFFNRPGGAEEGAQPRSSRSSTRRPFTSTASQRADTYLSDRQQQLGAATDRPPSRGEWAGRKHHSGPSMHVGQFGEATGMVARSSDGRRPVTARLPRRSAGSVVLVAVRSVAMASRAGCAPPSSRPPRPRS